MSKRLLIAGLVIVVLSCVALTIFMVVKAKQRSDEILNEFESTDKSLDQNSMDERLDHAISVAAGVDVEFPELHKDALSIIPDDKDERSILGEKLKAKGFIVTNWGRGNFEGGPRMVNVTFQKENCECVVSKMYYSTELDSMYGVQEKINCRKIN